MFLVLPATDQFTEDSARWFTDLDNAYDCAVEWSQQLQGQLVNLYELYCNKLSIVTQVSWE